VRKNFLRTLRLIPIKEATERRTVVEGAYWLTYYGCLILDRNCNPLCASPGNEYILEEFRDKNCQDADIQYFNYVSYVPPEEDEKCSRGWRDRSCRA
jgi:hypothetical protein